MKDRKKIAAKAFREGYNCAHAVLFAYADELRMDKETLSRIAAGMGGGMGRLQRTCGAVTGGIMVLGAMQRENYLQLGDNKEEMTRRIRNFVYEFENSFKSSQCRELIGVDLTTEAGRSEAEARNLSETHCLEYIYRSIELLDEELGI